MKAKTEEEFKKENLELFKKYEIIKFNGMKKKSIFKCSKHGLINKTPINFIAKWQEKCYIFSVAYELLLSLQSFQSILTKTNSKDVRYGCNNY